jgi:hypothetical protein
MINQVLNNMVKGLVLHYLRGGTVDKAIEQERVVVSLRSSCNACPE